MKRILAIVAALALFPATANELVRLTVRGDATQVYALYGGGVAAPAYAAILFSGGDAIVDFRDRPGGRFVVMRQGNFLVRSAELFAGDGFVAARSRPHTPRALSATRSMASSSPRASSARRAGRWVSADSRSATSKRRSFFVHHEEDGCAACRTYSETHWIGDYPLITVKGGDVGHGNPCEAQSHHGYLGQEQQVVAAIRSWIAGKPYPKVIE